MKQLDKVTFRFDPKDYKGNLEGNIHAVALRGEFLFYESGLTGHTDETGMMDCEKKYPPLQYQEGMEHISGLFYQDMTLNEEGIYETSLELPPGGYLYHFLLNPELDEREEDTVYTWLSNMILPDGSKRCLRNSTESFTSGWKKEKNHWISDPKNPPMAPTVTGEQMYSVCFVGTTDEVVNLPVEDPKDRGSVHYMSYQDVDDQVQSLAVYLPADYRKEETYPLILISHGGGGNEGDWICQGSVQNIMDRLIRDGKTRKAILVSMNNSVYDWDYTKIARNCEENIIPFLEKIFHISQETKDRAFCGLSLGSMTTMYMYMHRTENYDYFGAFSGGLASGEHFTLENPRLKDVTLMIGSGEEDFAYNPMEIGVPTTIEALKQAGLPFTSYFVPGSHDFFTWAQLFEHFAAEILWR